MKLKTENGSIELPENPTPQQRRAIALALIRSTFESDADRIGKIDFLPDGGWKTTYWVGEQQFELEYYPKSGFGKRPISSNFSETEGTEGLLDDAEWDAIATITDDDIQDAIDTMR